MPVPNMKAKPPRPNEEPYAGKLLVRFREGLGRRLPSLLDKSKIIFLIFTIALSAFAGNISIQFSPKVIKFKETYTKGLFRSGLLEENDNWWQKDSMTEFPNSYEDEEFGYSYFNKWIDTEDCEYVIVWSKPSDQEFRNYLIKSIKHPKLITCAYDTTYKSYILRSNIDIEKYRKYVRDYKYFSKKEDNYIDQGKNIAKKYLSFFRGKIEYAGSDFTYFNGNIETTILNFRRIFRHGIVSSDISYILVTIDVDGDIQKIEIKWPLFKRVYNKEKAIDFQNANSLANADFQDIGPAKGNGKEVQPKDILVSGMACGWRMSISDNGEDIITPCFKYSSRIVLENGDTTYHIIEVPRLAKYIK